MMRACLESSSCRSRPKGGLPASCRGAALVIVLSLIVLASLIASSHSRNAHEEMVLARRYLDTTIARYSAEAAMQLTIAELASPVGAEDVPVDGRLRALSVEGRDVLVSVRSARGLVDLNASNIETLRALFTAAGAGSELAGMLADRVLDWRDTDSLTHLNGAEDGDYRASGVPWTARDDAFVSVEELRYVLGMTPVLYQAVSPFLTVYSGSANVDIAAAPQFLSEAMGGGPAGGREAGSLFLRGGPGIYHINVGVPDANAVFYSMEAVVAVSRGGERPYRILEWREHSKLLTRMGRGEMT